jgi:tetratricopeptide (TPR) repeat protein
VRRLAILNLDRESTDAKLIPFLESEVKQDPRDPVALSRLATVYERVGAVDKARRAYEQALAISPQNVIVLVALAELSAEKLGNHKRAMELAKTARSLAPDDVSITHTLGRLASQTGDTADLDWSLSLLQETARRLPSNPQVIFDLAWSHYLSGRTVEAESEANAALKTGRPFPDSDSARRLLHFAALARNMAALKTSQNEITDCLSREPDYLPALFAAGLLREDEGQPNEAADLYRRVLDRYPVFTPAHKRLAQLYLDAIPNVQRAYDHAYRARERQPGDAEAAKLLGIAAFKRGDFAKSAQLLKESSKNRPNDAELFYFLGLAHYRLKQTDASKKALDQALALKLPSSMAEEAKRLMPELN